MSSEKFIVLKGIQSQKAFFCVVSPGEEKEDHTRLADGTVAYEVLCFVESVEEAQRVCHDCNGPYHLHDYIRNIVKEMQERARKVNDHSFDQLSADDLFHLIRGPDDIARR